MKELPEKVYNLLKKKYNVIDVISFLDFDSNFDLLKTKLLALKKDTFDVNDRIIIEHMDTDFYFEYCSVGINLLNFFNTVNDIDIPNFVFLFYTNHFGISKEINAICKDVYDRPSVIESFISDFHYNCNGYNNIDLSIDDINHQCLCMMNAIRSHRNAMFNSIKDIPTDNLIKAITINNNVS
jgi:hypothetical protein